jgi:hypothetical protein
MTIKTKAEGKKPQTYEVNGPITIAWSLGCFAIALLAIAAIVAVLALPIAALFRLIHG